MNSLISMIARTLVRGEVYKVMRKSKSSTSIVLAIAGAAVYLVMHR